MKINNSNRLKVGIAIIVKKDNKVLLSKRKGSHAIGVWQFAGGHLEFNESWEDCAKREIKEETDLEIKNICFAAVTNDILKDDAKHYITIFMIGDYIGGKAKVMEPDKAEYWDWYEWDKMPEPLFIPIQNLLKQGYNPFKNEDK